MSASGADQNPPSDKSGPERRGGGRRRVLKAGIIAFNNRHSTMPCAVRNLSDTGAQLRMPASLSPPDTFDLIIELDGIEANCTVVWRRGDDVGVHFTSPPRLTAPRRAQVVAPVVPPKTPSLRRQPPR